jgi:hypothetical protein
MIFVHVLYGIGVFAILSKIYIGVALLLVYNTALNYLFDEDFSIFWRYQISPIKVSCSRILLELFLVLLNINFEMLLMLTTSGNIDFKNYVYLLLSGYQKLEWFPVASRFIYNSSRNRKKTLP